MTATRMCWFSLAVVIMVIVSATTPAASFGEPRAVTGGVTARVQGSTLIVVDETIESGVTTSAISNEDGYEISSDGTETAGAGCSLNGDVIQCDTSGTSVTRMVVDLGPGNDTWGIDTGFHLNLTLRGGAGNDLLATGNGNDLVFGGAGNDRYLFNAGGNDRVWGESGDDVIRNNAGNFWASGGPGNDVIRGGNRVSTIFGGSGRDRLFVMDADGDDYVNGGHGVDAASFDRGDRVVSVETEL